MDTRLAELKWLSQQPYPAWGGHLERGEQLTDKQMQAWIADRIIQAVEKPCRGYVITEAGQQLIAQMEN